MSKLTILSQTTAIMAVLATTPLLAAERQVSSGTAIKSEALSPATEKPKTGTPAPGQSATSRQASDGVGLADIIVTAQRRSENLQKAAIAVTAVTADTLVRAGVQDTAQLTRVAPVLQVGNINGSANAFYLRGVGNFTINALSDSAISFNVDGVPFSRSQAAQGVFYDLERVEVLKGPQGTLYGRNSTGGAINVLTAKPIFGSFSGFGMFEYGNFDAKKFVGAVNIPIGEESALRVAGQINDRNGYYSDGTGDDKTRSIRGQFATHIVEGVKLIIGADYTAQRGVGGGGTLLGLGNDQRIGVFDPRATAIITSSFAFLAGTTLQPLVRNDFNHNDFWGVRAQADIDTPIGTLTILPSYRKMKLNQRSYASAFAYGERQDTDQTSIEVRLTSDSANRLSYIAGFYFLDENINERPTYDTQFVLSNETILANTKSYAGFGRLNFKITDTLRLTGGIRYTIDDKSAVINTIDSVVACPAVFVGGACPGTPALPSDFGPPSFLFAPNGTLIPVQAYGPSGAILQTTNISKNLRKTFRKPTYRAAIEYDLAPRSLLYASFETGFKAGGFFASTGSGVYDPETITAYTIGSKNSFFGNRLQVNLELFRWQYKNQQVSHLTLNGGGGVEFATENVGNSKLQGVELEARAKISSSLTANAVVQYLDAKNTTFQYSQPALAGPPVTGCPVSGPTANGVFIVNCGGRRPVNAPRWTLAGGVEKVVDLNSAGQLVFNADGRYQSASYTGFEQLAIQNQRAYAMLDLQATYHVGTSGFSIAGFVNNVTNKTVVAFSQPHTSAPSLLAETLRPPRTYGVRVNYKF